MTTRWKRLTALMLILLTLLNAGSALAAEEFWKWGDVYEEKLILGLPTEVTDLQVFQDELYFIYGDLLLKCHEPDDTPETVYELKNLLPENVKEDMLYASYDDYRLFTDGDSLYIFVTFMQRIYRLDFEDGETKPMLYATLDYSSLPELNWTLLDDDCCTFYKTYIQGKIVKIGDKIYMKGSDWSFKTPKLINSLVSFSLETGKGEILAYNYDDISEVVSWQQNQEWVSTLLVYYNHEEWYDCDEGYSHEIDERKLAVYNPEQRKAEETVLNFQNLGLENQLTYLMNGDFTHTILNVLLLHGMLRTAEFSSFTMILRGLRTAQCQHADLTAFRQRQFMRNTVSSGRVLTTSKHTMMARSSATCQSLNTPNSTTILTNNRPTKGASP